MAKIKITITTPCPIDVEVTERILNLESGDEQMVQIEKQLDDELESV